MAVYLSQVRTLQLADSYERHGPGSIPFPYAFVGHMPNLTSLHVEWDGLKTYLCCHPHTSLALSRFPSIRELSLKESAFPSFGHLRRTLTSLPNLTALSMHVGVCWPVPTAELPPLLTHGASTSSRPRLVTLCYTWNQSPRTVDRQRALQFLSWLASTSTGVSLHRLTLRSSEYPIDHSHGDLCGPAFIHSVARCVEELTLDIHSANGQSVGNLPAFRPLHTFRVVY